MNSSSEKDTSIFAVHRFDVDGQIRYSSAVEEVHKDKFQQTAMEIIGCKHLDMFPFKHSGIEFAIWFDRDIDNQPELPLPSLVVGNLGIDERCILVFGNYIITRTNEKEEVVGIVPTDSDILKDYAFDRSHLAVALEKLGLFHRM